MLNMVIRKATISDIDKGLFLVFKEGYEYHHYGRPDIFKSLTDTELKNQLWLIINNHNVLILEVNYVISGYIVYSFKGELKNKIHVEQIAVKKRARGRGYGKMLMNFLEKIGKENHCESIELDCWTFNKRAMHMYEDLEYKKQRIVYEKKI